MPIKLVVQLFADIRDKLKVNRSHPERVPTAGGELKGSRQ